MSTVVSLPDQDRLLTGDVLAHLEVQLESARRLLQIVLKQGEAIRERNVQSVVALTGMLQAEMQRRTLLEDERARLLDRAGARLGIAPGAVTLTLLAGLMPEPAAGEALQRSWELRGLLAELQREHTVNRALDASGAGVSRSSAAARRRPDGHWLRLDRRTAHRDSVPRREPPHIRPAGVEMPISSFMGLQTALRGLVAEQTAIDTTGHNIANANTPGYSRQTADLVESSPLTIPAYSSVTGGGVQIGTGVDVETINRIRNQFLDVQYRSQNTAFNDASTRAGILDQVQTGLAEPSDHGIASQLSAFWNAWSDVANAPQSQSGRQALIDSATTLATSFNQFDAQLSTIQSQAATQYAQLTGSTGRCRATRARSPS